MTETTANRQSGAEQMAAPVLDNNLRLLTEQLSEGGLSVLYLAAQMAAVPIQAALLQWVFEQSGQSFAAVDALADCERLNLAVQVESGLWQIDGEVASHIAISLSPSEEEKALQLKQQAVQYLTLAVDGQINAPLLASDLEHIRFLTAHADTDAQCDLLIWLADFSFQNGDTVTAAESWQTIYHYMEKTQGEEHEDTLTAMNNLSESLRQLGNLEDAKKLYKHQIEICHRVLGPIDDATLIAMNNLASVLREIGDLIGAKNTEEQVLEQRMAALGDDHPDTLICMNNLASTLKAMGEFDQARVLQQEILTKRKQLFPIEHPQVTESAWNLAQTFLAQDDYDSMQDVLFDDLFWLMDENAVIQTANQHKIRDMMLKLLNQK